MLRLHGLQDAADTPPDYLDLVHPSDREEVKRRFAESLATGTHRAQYRVVWPDGSTHWIEGVGETERDGSGAPVSIRGVCTLIDAQKREEADLRFMAQASAELARSSDYVETLRKVAAMAVPHFADWCAVDMLDAQGRLQRLAVAHIDPGKVELANALHRRYPPDPSAPLGTWNVLRTGKPEMLAEITDQLLERSARDPEHLAIVRSLGLKSYLGVPIVGPSQARGVVTFVSSDSGRIYTERDLHLAADLVARASVAIQNAELIQALRDSQQRQGFLLSLTDVLRRSASTQDVLNAVSEMLGRHFNVNRVGYGHVDETQDLVDYEICWTDGSVPPLLGQFAASAFGPQVIDRLRRGITVAIANVRNDPLTSELQTVRTSHEVDTRAILVVPLFTAGKLRTIVYLNQRDERRWDDAEVSLMEEVAERTRELIERGRTEQALRQSEARWRGLFERMTEGFFIAEALRDSAGRMVDFRFLQVNPAFETLTGIAPSAATGRPVSEVIPGFPSEVIDLYAGVVDSGAPNEFEVQVPALDDRWYEARARRVAENQFSVLFLEATERKKAQAELQLSAERYRTLFESIDEGFCIVEVLVDDKEQPTDYRFLEVNPAFERQSGLLQATGRTIRDLVPQIESHYIDTFGRVATTGETVRFESRAQALGRWFDAFAFRVGDPAQRRVAMLFTDITDRKNSQAALLEREWELREAQRIANIGSWVWDAAQDVTLASPELLQIFGVPEGHSLPGFAAQRGTLYAPEHWERLNEEVTAALTRGKPYAIDVQALRGDQRIWVTCRGTPVLAPDGRIIGLRGTVQDITERKQIEEALMEADARKDEFLATLAHELRNPLAPLRNGLVILSMSDGISAAGGRALALMERQLAHLVRLVDDLLDVSRVSQGKVTMQKKVTTLQNVVEQALETVRPLLEAAAHRLDVMLPDRPLLMEVDVTRIAQVLANLLNNAIKYTPSGGTIALQATVKDSRTIRISVSDNGIGIPPSMLEAVFDLFTQVGSAVDRSKGGLGIGLSLARRLVEMHGGKIHAASAGEQMGSTFIVELPTLDVAAGVDMPSARPHEKPASTGRRVLVVDDNIDAAESMGMLLTLEGNDVLVVHRGADVLEAVRKHAPDVIFLDIGLPDFSGYEVAAQLKQERLAEHALLVALTGWGSERDRERAYAAGFHLHLTKPVSPEDIAGALLHQAEPRPEVDSA